MFICMLSSCKHTNEQRIKELAQQWINREIIYPEGIVFTLKGEDTIPIPKDYKYTIVSYVDSMGCTSCRLSLQNWKDFMKEIEDSVSLKFFLCPNDLKDLIYTLKLYDFQYPVCIDLEDSFNKANKFPSNSSFQTFLINKENKVIAFGNPIHSTIIKDLYLKIIKGEDTGSIETVKTITTVSVDRTTIDMGKFDWRQEQKATFTLTNTGDKPFAIATVKTSCGCTTVDYDPKPVRPGESVSLHVTYKAENTGFFQKTLTVYCNTKDAPLRLKILGSAE